MAHSSKRKGNRFEREVVHAAEDAGLDATRAWNSMGESIGEHTECDVRLETPAGDTWTVQAKRRQSVAKYLTCENADVTVIREDRGDPLVVVGLDTFLDLLQNDDDDS